MGQKRGRIDPGHNRNRQHDLCPKKPEKKPGNESAPRDGTRNDTAGQKSSDIKVQVAKDDLRHSNVDRRMQRMSTEESKDEHSPQLVLTN